MTGSARDAFGKVRDNDPFHGEHAIERGQPCYSEELCLTLVERPVQ